MWLEGCDLCEDCDVLCDLCDVGGWVGGLEGG